MEESYSNYYASPSNFPNTNNISYFAHQAIRVRYASPELRRRDCYRNPDPHLGFRDSIQRELEKERIRAEIIAEEVFRRKLLEDEVRRELMMEREISRRRGGGGDGGERLLTFGSTMRFEHKENNNRGVRVPLLTNFEHQVGVSPHREIGFSESRTLPFQRDPVVAGNVDSRSWSRSSVGVKLKEIKEIKGFAVEVMNKDKVVFLAKPNATDLKRKATTPLVAPVEPTAGLKKPKTKDEWSCVLCQVTATSEQALNDHLQGKKHKSRESGLNSQRTGFDTGPLPKMGRHSLNKPIKVSGTTYRPSSKDRVGADESSLEKVYKSASQKLPITNQKTSAVKGFKFFCETCQVGVDKLKVLNAHKKGKRHRANAMKLNEMDDISTQKSTVEKKTVTEEPAIASSLEKGVVVEEKEMDVSVAYTSLEKGVVEEEKEVDTSVLLKKLRLKEKTTK